MIYFCGTDFYGSKPVVSPETVTVDTCDIVLPESDLKTSYEYIDIGRTSLTRSVPGGTEVTGSPYVSCFEILVRNSEGRNRESLDETIFRL